MTSMSPICLASELGLLLAIIHQPKLLVLDEPTNGLDVKSINQFINKVTTFLTE